MGEIDNKIQQIVKEMHGVDATYIKEWNGYSVYSIVYKGNVVGGFPLVILASSSEVRLSTTEECISFWGLHCNFKK